MSLLSPRVSFLSYFTLLMFHIPHPVSHVMLLFSSTDKSIQTFEVIVAFLLYCHFYYGSSFHLIFNAPTLIYVDL